MYTKTTQQRSPCTRRIQKCESLRYHVQRRRSNEIPSLRLGQPTFLPLLVLLLRAHLLTCHHFRRRKEGCRPLQDQMRSVPHSRWGWGKQDRSSTSRTLRTTHWFRRRILIHRCQQGKGNRVEQRHSGKTSVRSARALASTNYCHSLSILRTQRSTFQVPRWLSVDWRRTRTGTTWSRTFRLSRLSRVIANSVTATSSRPPNNWWYDNCTIARTGGNLYFRLDGPIQTRYQDINQSKPSSLLSKLPATSSKLGVHALCSVMYALHIFSASIQSRAFLFDSLCISCIKSLHVFTLCLEEEQVLHV